MTHAPDGHVAHDQIGVFDPCVAARQDQLVEVAVEGEEAGRALGRRLGQVADEVGARPQLANQRQHLGGPGEFGPLVRGAQRDQGADSLVSAHPLHVVPGDQAAERVTDDVDAFVAGVGGEPLDRLGEVAGRSADVAGQEPVVEPGQIGETSAPQGPLEQGEDRVVVDDAVDEEDRGGSGVDRVVDQAALLRAEAGQIVPPPRLRATGSASSPSGYIIRWAVTQPASSATPDAIRGTSRVSTRETPAMPALSTPEDYAVTGGPSASVDMLATCRPIDPAAAAHRGGQAGTGRPRPRREGGGPGAPGRRHGGHLHRSPPDARADRGTALAEDADAIGLSVLSGAHMTLFRKVVDLLAEADASDIVVFGGGIIPEADRALWPTSGSSRSSRPAPPWRRS